jgi:hypothetical protein
LLFHNAIIIKVIVYLFMTKWGDILKFILSLDTYLCQCMKKGKQLIDKKLLLE